MMPQNPEPDYELHVQPENIPQELKRLPQWVGWRWKRVGEKITKVPVRVDGQNMADSTDPETWDSFDNAARLARFGFVFSENDPYAGIDFDDCVDPDTGEIDSDTQRIISALNSYSEFSPSGTGVKVIVRGNVSRHGKRRKNSKKKIEMYDFDRFFTTTGHRVPGTPEEIGLAEEQIETLYGWLFPAKEGANDNGIADSGQRWSTDLTDEDILSIAFRSRVGREFMALWNGDHAAYGSESEADLALCSYLAFYTGPDPRRVEEMFSQSGLGKRGKWKDREDYRQRTIDKALADMTDFYDPDQGGRNDSAKLLLSGLISGDSTGASVGTGINSDEDVQWPELDSAALYGLPGEIVRIIEPHTEADPVALLTNLLSAFGNAIGRGAFMRVGADLHYLKMYPALVGESSKGRKGMSWGHPKEFMEEADEEWTRQRVLGGLSSGEGLIFAVRDRVEGEDKNGDPKTIDEGVRDKRLLILESEMANVLKVMNREGNTLSPLIRMAWDDGPLQTLTKNNPMRATEPHVSIIGHITKSELLRHLTETESANGFANRFLWMLVKRSKQLPFGGELYKENTSGLKASLKEAVDYGQRAGEIGWGESAREKWADIYGPLSEGKPGLFGAVTSRAEAQVLRLAAIYAVMNGQRHIELGHLDAALAVWRYAEQSARYIFGDATGDPVADQIMEALRAMGGDGMTRNEIREMFGRHKSSERISQALSMLQRFGRVTVEKEDTAGRPTERWKLA